MNNFSYMLLRNQAFYFFYTRHVHIRLLIILNNGLHGRKIENIDEDITKNRKNNRAYIKKGKKK